MARPSSSPSTAARSISRSPASTSGRPVHSPTSRPACGWSPPAATTRATTSTPRPSPIAASKRPHPTLPRERGREERKSSGATTGASSLRSQALDAPAAFCVPRVADPVVEAVVAMYPELDRLRTHPIAAPVRRQGNRGALVLRGQRGHRILQNAAIWNYAALWRRPGAELAGQGTVVEIDGRLLGRLLDDRAGDANLPPELRPVDDQRRAWVLREVAPFLAVVVGEEAEAALVDASQQDHPRRRLTRARAGREGHRLGENLARRDRVAEPGIELLQRVGVDGVLRELARAVYGSNPCDQRTLPSLSTGACWRAISQTPAASSCAWASISSRSVLANRSHWRGLIDQPSASIFLSSTESLRRRETRGFPSARTDALARAESALVP